MSKAKATGPRVFVPMTKVDEEQRLVYGTITEEVVDQAGEMMDYESSKPHFQKWSDDIHVASGGLSKGNVRVMHGLTVAGKLTELEFNDDDKSIEVCAKVVDDTEWNKVLEGCYTGFSVGGKYGKKWNAKGEDGTSIKKYEAKPNEVSLVDNPCVKSATFSLVKADGAEEQVMFKVAAEEGETTEEKTDAAPVETDKPAAPSPDEVQISNGDVANKATEMAKAAADGTTWQDHIEAAREELIKAATPAAKKDKKDDDKDGNEKEENESADEAAQEKEANADDKDDDDVSKVTPAGVKQVWTASDGKTFEKKADAETHEATLTKAAEEPQSEADKAVANLEKATARLANLADGTVEVDETPSIFSMERIEELHKAFLELESPRDENAEPLLEKGMYTVSRFAEMLGRMADLSRTIKAEGKLEGGDKTDSDVAAALIAQVGGLGESFIDYSKQQVAELVAGIDVDCSPRACYDYYYRSAGEGNDLAKAVVEMIEGVEDQMEETVEKLAKFAAVEGTVLEDTPETLAKIATLEGENSRLIKAVETQTAAMEGIEERLKKMEDTPLPRVPAGGHVVEKGGDSFLGKAASTNEDKIAILSQMLNEHGADGMATMMIKASHATGGHKLSLKQ